MRSFLLISVFLVGAAGTSLSAENDVPKDHLKGFGDWIRYYGYNCGKAKFGQLAGVDLSWSWKIGQVAKVYSAR